MNKLPLAKRTPLSPVSLKVPVSAATSRMTGVAYNTVLKFMADVGRVCSIYQDKTFVKLKFRRLQCDEIWSSVGAKEKNTSAEKKNEGGGRRMEVDRYRLRNEVDPLVVRRPSQCRSRKPLHA